MFTALPTYTFYLIHVNYYCHQENGTYTPCELALAEFSFVDGVRRVYHTLMNPGEGITAGFLFGFAVHCPKHAVPFQDLQSNEHKLATMILALHCD
jgi:hypothetical protein